MAIDVVFQSFSATPLSKSPEASLIRWSLMPTKIDLADYEFYVDRSRSPDQATDVLNLTIDGNPAKPDIVLPKARNLEQIAGPISALDFLQYVDYTANFWDIYKSDYYKVRCRRISTQEEISTDSFAIQGELDVVGLYIVDESNFLLEDTTGAPTYVYKRRSSGVQCLECFDPVLKKRMKSECKTCFGTNWAGGFYAPLFTYVDFDPSEKVNNMQDWGETKSDTTNFKLSNWPRVESGDVLLELRTMRRWRVGKHQDTEKRRIPMLQFGQCSEINIGDIEYKIPYDVQTVQKILEEFEAMRQRREF